MTVQCSKKCFTHFFNQAKGENCNECSLLTDCYLAYRKREKENKAKGIEPTEWYKRF